MKKKTILGLVLIALLVVAVLIVGLCLKPEQQSSAAQTPDQTQQRKDTVPSGDQNPSSKETEMLFDEDDSQSGTSEITPSSEQTKDPYSQTGQGNGSKSTATTPASSTPEAIHPETENVIELPSLPVK